MRMNVRAGGGQPLSDKAFTLIELLAVIVILAIISLIATPIILGIIKDSKKESAKVSAENYLDAVELAVANKNTKGIFNPTECKMEGTSVICTGEFDAVHCDEENACTEASLEVKVDGEVPTSVTIKFQNGTVVNGTTITIGGSSLIKNNNKIKFQKEIIVGNFNSVCEIASDSTVQGYEAGAKYNCKVDPNKDRYTFYVLKTPEKGSKTINLIMDQNINSDGTPAGLTAITKEENQNKYNLVPWFNEDGIETNEYGPVTAIKFLYNATKDWTNVSPLNFEYRDKEEQGTTLDAQIGYTSFKSVNGILTITGKSSTNIGTESTPLRARLPIHSNDSSKVEVFDKIDSNQYLYDNLNEIGSPVAYWTLSSYVVETPGGTYCGKYLGYGYFGRFMGRVASTNVTTEEGIRPVITLNI